MKPSGMDVARVKLASTETESRRRDMASFAADRRRLLSKTADTDRPGVFDVVARLTGRSAERPEEGRATRHIALLFSSMAYGNEAPH